MTLPRTVADVLSDHVRFEVECIDRLYLNVWQPRLAYGGGVAGFFTSHRGYAYASTALMDPMSKAFVADIHHFIAAHGVDLVHFAKGQRKDEVTQRLLADFTGTEGVLYAGRAQEKSNVWGTQRRYHADGRSYAWLVRSTAFINFFYFYCVDEDFGPFFIKFSTYFPFTAKLCINGNEWAKRQAAKAGIGFEPLDNGFAAVDDVAALQAICDSLGPAHIEALLRKWLRILPSPFTAGDEDAGYRYELSVLQAEAEDKRQARSALAGLLARETRGSAATQLVAGLVQLAPTAEDKRQAVAALAGLLARESDDSAAGELVAGLVQLAPTAEDKRQARAALAGLLARETSAWGAVPLARGLVELDPTAEDKRQARAALAGLLARETRGSVATQLVAGLVQLDPTAEDKRQAVAALAGTAHAYSANAPRQKPSTSSPLRSPRTFAPAASTTPAASIPATRAFGLVSPTPMSRATSGSPRRMCQSAGLSAAACTRTSTSPGPISGTSVSASRRTSGGPNLSWTIAFTGSSSCHHAASW